MTAIEKEQMQAYLKDADDNKERELLKEFKTENICHELERRMVEARERITRIKALSVEEMK